MTIAACGPGMYNSLMSVTCGRRVNFHMCLCVCVFVCVCGDVCLYINEYTILEANLVCAAYYLPLASLPCRLSCAFHIAI